MKALEQQLSEYCELQEEIHGPVTIDELASPRLSTREKRTPGWLVAAAVGAVVVAVGLLTGLLAGSGMDTDPARPTDTTLDISQPVSVTWSAVEGLQPWQLHIGLPSIVSNGSSLLGLFGSDPNSTSDLVLMRSVDGVEWTEVEAPTRFDPFTAVNAVGDTYLMSHSEGLCMQNGQPCPLWLSDDGLEWERADSMLDHRLDLIDVNWLVKDHETILTTRPVRSNGLDAFYRVIMEFDDRLIQYRTEYPNYDSGDPAFTEFAGTVSSDGVEWSPMDEPPPFTETLDDEYLRAGWQWMWRCETAYQNSQAMMLVTDAGIRQLWTTNDGINWQQLPNPPQPADPSRRGQCIHPTQQGWLLTPGGRSIEGQDSPFITAGPAEMFYSADGSSWTPITSANQPPETEGIIEVAGNTIFIIHAETGEIASTGTISR